MLCPQTKKIIKIEIFSLWSNHEYSSDRSVMLSQPPKKEWKKKENNNMLQMLAS